MSLAGITTLFTVCFLTAPEMKVAPQASGTALQSQVAKPLPNYWMTSFDDARKIAARNKLPLVLHFDATWCSACRRMDTEVLDRPQVRSLLGSSVIGVRIDADRYKNLISEFGISTLPTEVVVLPDGSRGKRHVGAVDLTEYTARLRNIYSSNRNTLAKSDVRSEPSADRAKNTRSCLIVKHDGKTVGLGGYSPVALTTERQWKKGTQEFVAAHEGVDYFFQNAEEMKRFRAQPGDYIPGLHGCDPVALFQQNVAAVGAIEYGAFYQGKVFFFASLQNRDCFENNPGWYSGIRADARTENDDLFPFLSIDAVNN